MGNRGLMATKSKVETIRKGIEPRSVPVGIRVSPTQAAKLRKDARDSGRSLSGHVIFYLKIAGAL